MAGETAAPIRPRVLIADDEVMIAQILARSLTRPPGGPCDVQIVHDGRSAIAEIGRYEFDLVIADIMMPGASGIDVTRAAKLRRSETEVIVITGNATLDTAVEALRAGAYDYIQKPFEDVKLINLAVGRALERQRLIAENERMLRALQARTSELEEVNRALVETQEQLVQVGKMSALGQLSAGLAHEINNPLHFILGDLFLMAEDLKRLRGVQTEEEFFGLVTTLDERHRRLRDGTRRIETIVTSLRSFSRPSLEGASSLDVHEAVEQILVILDSKMRGRVTVERCFGAVPAVSCLAGQINQVLMNVLDNAIAAMAGSGTLTIATRHDAAAGLVCVSVRDTGTGIHEKVLPRIFDPFFTTKGAGEGTGLGLSISYGVVARHEGRIWAENNAGGPGATFHVELPVAFRSTRVHPDVVLK